MRRASLIILLVGLTSASFGCERERALDTLVHPNATKLKVAEAELRPVPLGAGYQTLLPSSFRCASDRISTLYIHEIEGRARTLIFAQSNTSLSAALGAVTPELLGKLMRSSSRGAGMSRFERERMVLEMPIALGIGDALMGTSMKASEGSQKRSPAGAREESFESLVDPSFLESLMEDEVPSGFDELKAAAAPLIDREIGRVASFLGLGPIGDRTGGVGLGFTPIPGSFAGWSWLRFHHTEDEPAYRFARQDGKWIVRAGYRSVELNAYHLMGHLGSDDAELQLIVLCEQATGCIDGEAILTVLTSAQQNTQTRRPPPSSNCRDGNVAELASRFGFTIEAR